MRRDEQDHRMRRGGGSRTLTTAVVVAGSFALTFGPTGANAAGRPRRAEGPPAVGGAASSGHATARRGLVEGTRVQVELFPEPPEMTPELRKFID